MSDIQHAVSTFKAVANQIESQNNGGRFVSKQAAARINQVAQLLSTNLTALHSVNALNSVTLAVAIKAHRVLLTGSPTWVLNPGVLPAS